jgi:hypothetical protein
MPVGREKEKERRRRRGPFDVLIFLPCLPLLSLA